MRSTTVLNEIGADELPLELVLNKIDAVDSAAPAAAREPLPEARCRSRRAPARGSTSCASASPSGSRDRFELVRLLVPYDEGARLAELYALGAPIDEREDTPRACSCARGCRAASCAASRPSWSPSAEARASA